MIRILLSLAIAAAAFFGPWTMNTGGMFDGVAADEMVHGQHFAQSTVNCLMDMNFSIEGECAPAEGMFGKAVTATIVIGVAAAAFSILGLLPLIGRLTSFGTLLSGLLALGTVGWLAYCLLTKDGSAISDMRWGAFATGGFGLLTLFAGMGGIGGHDD